LDGKTFTKRTIEYPQPDIILLWAYTAVDKAELETDWPILVNHQAVQVLALMKSA
jgi:dTDP-4-dehydrorhamnose reductase